MTAREEGHRPDASRPDASLPVAGDELLRVLTDAFDYRGDVTLSLQDGSSLTGYVFSVEPGAAEPHVKLFTADSPERVKVPLSRIAGCSFSGRDTADGRSWEAWVKRYDERKRLREEGVDAGDIEPKAEDLS